MLLPISLGRAGQGFPGFLPPHWSGSRSSGTRKTFGQREFKEQLMSSALSSGLTLGRYFDNWDSGSSP